MIGTIKNQCYEYRICYLKSQLNVCFRDFLQDFGRHDQRYGSWVDGHQCILVPFHAGRLLVLWKAHSDPFMTIDAFAWKYPFGNDVLRHRIFDHALNSSLERSSAIARVISDVCNKSSGTSSDPEFESGLLDSLLETLELDVYDLLSAGRTSRRS